MKCLERCLGYSKCFMFTSYRFTLCIFSPVLSAAPLSSNAVIYTWQVWTLGWGGHPDHLLAGPGPAVGAAENGGWASLFGRHRALLARSQAGPDRSLAPGCPPAQLEEGSELRWGSDWAGRRLCVPHWVMGWVSRILVL